MCDNKIKIAKQILKSYKLIQVKAKLARETREEEAETRITSQFKDVCVSTYGVSDKVGDSACRLATKSKYERQLDIINNFLESLSDIDRAIVKRNIWEKETILDLGEDYQLGIAKTAINNHKKKILENFSLLIFDGDNLSYIFS